MAESNRCGAGLEYENLHPFVRDMTFPAGRNDIIRHAEQHGADKDILTHLRSLPDREYGALEDLTRACTGSETH